MVIRYIVRVESTKETFELQVRMALGGQWEYEARHAGHVFQGTGSYTHEGAAMAALNQITKELGDVLLREAADIESPAGAGAKGRQR